MVIPSLSNLSHAVLWINWIAWICNDSLETTVSALYKKKFSFQVPKYGYLNWYLKSVWFDKHQKLLKHPSAGFPDSQNIWLKPLPRRGQLRSLLQ